MRPKDSTPLTKAEEELVKSNTHVVNIICRKYAYIPSEDAEDLRSYLQYSLCRAAQRFSPDRASPNSYFTATLNGEAKHYFRDTIWKVRPPRVYRDGAISSIIIKNNEESCAPENLSVEYNRLYTAASPIPFDTISDEDLVTDDFSENLVDGITLKDLITNLIEAFPEVERDIVRLIIQYGSVTHVFIIDWIVRTFNTNANEAKSIALCTQKRLQQVYTNIVDGGIQTKLETTNPQIQKLINRRLSQ